MKNRIINFIDIENKNKLVIKGDNLVDESNGKIIAPIVDDIPRFVKTTNYADSFGVQWNHWENNLSSIRNPDFGHHNVLIERTKFDKLDTSGKTILECGAGGGDDTEVLCSLPFSEIHSFDLSNSINRSKKYISDKRVVLSQASIYDIPYENEIFDFVFCHRVLQHTPNPILSLKSICKKVKPGGYLFAHSYNRTKIRMSEWRYKYLWLTRHLPLSFIKAYVYIFGYPLHKLTDFLSNYYYGKKFAYKYIPFYYFKDVDKKLTQREIIDIKRLITFDALTPAFDSPITNEDFINTIVDAGFEIIHSTARNRSQWCTAMKK